MSGPNEPREQEDEASLVEQLPDLGDDGDDGEGLEDAPIDLQLHDDDDPFDDGYATDLPIDLTIVTASDEPSAIGDDATGVEAAPHEDIAFDESGASMLDAGSHPTEGIALEGDDELGIAPIPREMDDGGLEGLDDAGDAIDEAAFPTLDGDASDDDEPLDLGLELPIVE